MTTSARSRWVAAGAFLVSALAATTSRAEVTALGDYSTTVAIEVPSFRGMAPTVQLVYSASAGNGVVGVGWQLDATSAIVRTGAPGGVPRQPPSTTGDRFVLDGEQLIPCTAGSTSPSCTTALHTRGSSAGFYSTRRESFHRLQYSGGVAPWTVWLTDGRTGRYETLDGGLSWLLTHSEDRHGNALDYGYHCAPDYECELESIRYGGNGATVGAEVHFYYEARPDITKRATGAGYLISARRLRSISVAVGGSLARAYALTYRTSTASGRSVLASVQQFARDAIVNTTSDPGKVTAGPTAPLPATTFGAASQSGGMGWRFGSLPGTGLFVPSDLTQGPVPRHYQGTQIALGAGSYYNASVDDYLALPYQKLIGDFDGDGRADLVIGYVKTKCKSIGFDGALTRKGGYKLIPARIATSATGIKDCAPTWWVADVDGDHRDDVIYKFHDTLYAARLTSTGFVAMPTSQAWSIKPDHCEIADVDGDSRDDLVCLSDQSGAVRIVTARSKGNGGYATTVALSGVALTDPMATGDFNGDGFADVAVAKALGSTRTLVTLMSRGDGTYAFETQWTPWAIGPSDQLRAADVDGDGLNDLVLTRQGTGVAGAIALSVEGVAAGRYDLHALASPWSSALLGDVDGDGKLDLIRPTDLTAAIGDGLGGFSPPASVFPVQCTEPYIADTDGDGRTDLICIDDLHDPSTPITVDDYSSGQPLRDPHRWMSGDLDGDGQGDFVYVRAKNPGIDVVTVLTTGTPHRVTWSRSPSSLVPGLDDSSAAHWLVADVGGPQGRADGKDDLVMVDTDGTTLRVYALLSNGDGTYNAIADKPWRNASGTVLPYDASDLGNFWPIDVDGSGTIDLVHTVPRGSGVQVDLLIARGDGKWTSSALPYFSGTTPKLTAVTDFRPMEVNGDGLIDLVNVQSGGAMTGSVIRSLISRGDGTFAEVAQPITASYLDVARWQPLDANGDGMTDLVHIKSSTAAYSSGLSFQILLSRGDGTYGGYTTATAWLSTTDQELANALEATSFLSAADLDGDGLTDLLHVSRYRDAAGNLRTALVRVLNPGSSSSTWRVEALKPGTALPAGAPWAWRPYRDTAHPNSAGFGLVDQGSGALAVYDIPSDRLIHLDNGNGGTTDIEYGPLLGHRDYLPSGFVPIVTLAVTRNDLAYAPVVTERTTYGYAGARWSDAQRRMLGYAYVGARGPDLIGITRYTTDEACAGIPTLSFSADATTAAVYSYTTRALVAPGTGPYTCLVQQQSQYSCDGGAGCRLDDDLQQTFDAYGNVVATTEHAADAPTRKTSAPVYANEDAYVVDLPAYRAIYQDDGVPVLMSQDLFEYDANTTYLAPPGPQGEVHRVQHWDGGAGQYVKTELTYDASGLLVRITDPQGGWTEVTYDTTYHAFPVQTCDPVGCSTMAWDTVLGRVADTTDVNRALTHVVLDGHGRITEVQRPDGSKTRTLFLNLGTVTGPPAQRQRQRTEVVDGSPGDGVLWSESLLDGWGRTYRTEHEGGAARITEYNDLSVRPHRISETFATASTPQRFTEYAYDGLGRLIQQTASDGSVRKWRFGLGKADATDELGKVRTIAYDGLGEVIRVTEANVDTSYGYDAAHRLVGSIDAAGLITSYYFDSLGRLIGERDPDRGLRNYTYRADGRLTSQVDAKGQRIDYTYDAAARAIRREDRDTAGTVVRTVEWTYDEIPGVGPQGASRGHVVAIDDSQGTAKLSTRYTYDLMGRVTEEQHCVDGTCYGMRRGFDQAGRLSRLTYPDAAGAFGPRQERVDYTYDDAGRLHSVGGYVTGIDYDVAGLPTELLYGNGIKTDYTYDPDRRWTTDVTIGNGSPLYRANYVHDPRGKIIVLDESAPTNTDVMQFSYDDLGRLWRVRATDPRLDRDYAYDAIGRMTYNSQLGDYHYNDPDHPHAVTSTDHGAKRAYDANGNGTYLADPSGRRLRVKWTVDDRPAGIDGTAGTYQMAYESDGRRVKKAGPNDTAIYFGEYLAVEGGRFIKYYYAGSQLVARDDGAVAYYHQDHSHSTRLETDGAGRVANAYQYDVTGVPVVEQETLDDDIGFRGVHGDQELGLTYMAARYYDPVTARFLSADSVVRDAYEPQSLDRYAYVENDPVNYWDPGGHLRRDIELMKERKQMWRSLMVAWEASLNFCGSAPEFCTTGISHSIVVWGKDGSVKAVIMPGMDPAVAKWQWSQAFPATPDTGATTAGATTSAGSAATTGTAGSAGAGGGGGGGSMLGTALQVVMGASRNPGPASTSVEMAVPIGGSETASHKELNGDFGGTTVTATVLTDDQGKIVKVAVVVSGRDVGITGAEILGDRVSVQLTKDRGETSVTIRAGEDSKKTEDSENKLGGSGGRSKEGKDAPVSFKLGLDGSHTGKDSTEEKRNRSSESTAKFKSSTSLGVVFHVTVEGKPTPPPQPPVKGIVEQLDRNGNLIKSTVIR